MNLEKVQKNSVKVGRYMKADPKRVEDKRMAVASQTGRVGMYL